MNWSNTAFLIGFVSGAAVYALAFWHGMRVERKRAYAAGFLDASKFAVNTMLKQIQISAAGASGSAPDATPKDPPLTETQGS